MAATTDKLTQVTNQLLQTPEGQAAFHAPGSPLQAGTRVLTLALKKGLIQPADLDPQHYRVDQTGTVHMNEGLPLAAKIALAAIGTAVGGSLIAGIGGAAAPGAEATGSVLEDGTIVGGAGGAAAAGGGAAATTGIAGTGLTTAQLLHGGADILGGAAAGNLKGQQTQDTSILGKGNLQLNRNKFAISAPKERLQAGILASMSKNATPAVAHWGGPGSGLRGEVPMWTGGANSITDALKDPGVQQLSQSTLDDELAQQLGQHDSSLGDAANVGNESIGDKILGGGATAASILSLIASRKKGGTAVVPPVPGAGQFLDAFGNPQD